MDRRQHFDCYKKIVSPTVGEKQKQVNKQNPQRWAPDFIKYEESL